MKDKLGTHYKNQDLFKANICLAQGSKIGAPGEDQIPGISKLIGRFSTHQATYHENQYFCAKN